MKLGRLGFRRTGHSSQFLIKPEIILNGDGRQRLRFAINLNAFFGFHCLMQTVAPPPARHFAAGELVDDHYLIVFYDVLNVFLEQAVSAKEL